ncbi:MAG: transmembrane 220 family protein [Flavobacteriales bacterium]|nr:MAG: transmembrane 220 family protein [Flavobacteriales bacterium]
MKKIFYALLALVFALFAYWNLNDPDPWIWATAYAAVLVLFALAVLGRADRRISGWYSVALGIWMLTMSGGMLDWANAGFPSIADEMKATAPHIEVVREFLGLFIAVAALAWLAWSTPKEMRMG